MNIPEVKLNLLVQYKSTLKIITLEFRQTYSSFDAGEISTITNVEELQNYQLESLKSKS